MLKKWSYNFHSNCQINILTLEKCSQKFVTLDNTRIIRPKIFLHWKFYRFLSKNCTSSNLLGSEGMVLWLAQRLPKGIVHPHKKLHEAYHTGYYGKCLSNNYFHWKGCLFFGNLCFQQHLRCSRNDLITSTVIVRILFCPLQTVPWGVSHSILREKIGQNLFFTGKVAFFYSKFCVLNNILGPEEVVV